MICWCKYCLYFHIHSVKSCYFKIRTRLETLILLNCTDYTRCMNTVYVYMYTPGIFCLVTACERSPCVYGNCSLVSSEGGEAGEAFVCACARGWRGRRCAERVRACASKPCNNRGACSERDGAFLCQCNPSWKGKRYYRLFKFI